MVKLNPEFAPMLEGCLANRNKWVEIEEGKEDKNDSKWNDWVAPETKKSVYKLWAGIKNHD